jgi:AcrR family transcriptional regulator
MSAARTPAGPRAHARQYVLEVAARVLAENPQATTQDIATAAGVGRATVYRWFESRDHLISAIVDHVVEQADERIHARLARGGHAVDVLEGMARDIVALGDSYRFLLGELEGRSEEKRADDPTSQAMWRFISDAQAAGELRDDVPAVWVGEVFGALVKTACLQLSRGELAQEEAGDLVARTVSSAFAPNAGARGR